MLISVCVPSELQDGEESEISEVRMELSIIYSLFSHHYFFTMGRKKEKGKEKGQLSK